MAMGVGVGGGVGLAALSIECKVLTLHGRMALHGAYPRDDCIAPDIASIHSMHYEHKEHRRRVSA